jgi:hypothetical protein
MACIGLFVVALFPAWAAAEVTIRLGGKQNSQVEVAGLPAASLVAIRDVAIDQAAWDRIFPLRVATAARRPAPPVLGSYAVVDDRLIFKPRFPFKPGLTYRAVFDPAALPAKLAASFERIERTLSIPAIAPTVPTFVTGIYPTTDVLQENLLKLYLHFSAPMSRGDSYKHIHLLDSAGKPVDLPFLELAEELWDDSGRRLTVLLDPGRIKRDLVPHDEVGPPLHAGETCVLEIDAAWLDSGGRPLAKSSRKQFRVAARDDRQPDPQRWQLTPPAAGTRNPLVVTFDEPLDHAMLQHAIQVAATSGTSIEGEVVVDVHETRWSFRPASRWLPGKYELRIDPTLEDLAGNSPGRPFEVRPKAASSVPPAHCQVPFEIRPIDDPTSISE